MFSDKYERFLDKNYQLAEDVDFMLQAQKWLIASQGRTGTAANNYQEEPASGEQLESRRLLASRLDKFAKLGGQQSKQLIDLLRDSLGLGGELLAFNRYRALRLIAPTSELSGRFTCSVSSLDGDDLRATRLVIYGKYFVSCELR